MTLWLRSLAFNIGFYVWTVAMAFGALPLLLFDRSNTLHAMAFWTRGVDWLLRVLVNVRIEIRGREHLPLTPCVVASKHQSAWDTMTWHTLLPDPAMVMKKELMNIPLYSAHAGRIGMIPVDRDAGAVALRGLLKGAQKAKADGRHIVIFPEGTRSAIGAPPDYQPGIAALYRSLDLPVVPVALNSGVFWPRHRFIRQPGTLVLEFLPPIVPGLKREAFMAELENRIETATDRLVAEAQVKLSAPA